MLRHPRAGLEAADAPRQRQDFVLAGRQQRTQQRQRARLFDHREVRQGLRRHLAQNLAARQRANLAALRDRCRRPHHQAFQQYLAQRCWRFQLELGEQRPKVDHTKPRPAAGCPVPAELVKECMHLLLVRAAAQPGEKKVELHPAAQQQPGRHHRIETARHQGQRPAFGAKRQPAFPRQPFAEEKHLLAVDLHPRLEFRLLEVHTPRQRSQQRSQSPFEFGRAEGQRARPFTAARPHRKTAARHLRRKNLGALPQQLIEIDEGPHHRPRHHRQPEDPPRHLRRLGRRGMQE